MLADHFSTTALSLDDLLSFIVTDRVEAAIDPATCVELDEQVTFTAVMPGSGDPRMILT